MSKPIERRTLQRARRFHKERSVTYPSNEAIRPFNISRRFAVNAERCMKAVDENHGRFA